MNHTGWRGRTNQIAHSKPCSIPNLGNPGLGSFMSKAITCPVILGRVSTCKDGSLTLSLSTPELDAEAKLVFLEIQNTNLKMLLTPAEGVTAEMKEVRSQFETKTPSQRLRSLLYIHWKQTSGTGEFEDHYRREMDRIINDIKQRLEPKP